jgi:hypothetical protein
VPWPPQRPSDPREAPAEGSETREALRAVPLDGTALEEFAATVFRLVDDSSVGIAHSADWFLACQPELIVESVALG